MFLSANRYPLRRNMRQARNSRRRTRSRTRRAGMTPRLEPRSRIDNAPACEPARQHGRSAMRKHFVLGVAVAAGLGLSAPVTSAEAQDGIYVPLLTYRT